MVDILARKQTSIILVSYFIYHKTLTLPIWFEVIKVIMTDWITYTEQYKKKFNFFFLPIIQHVFI